MAETSEHHFQAPTEEPSELDDRDHDQDHDEDEDISPAERDAREATELARIRRQYSRASTHHLQGSSTVSNKPGSILGRFRYSLSRFWKHQVSVVVPHDTCRDHLGMSISIYFSSCDVNRLINTM